MVPLRTKNKCNEFAILIKNSPPQILYEPGGDLVPTYNNVMTLLFFILTGKIQSVDSFPTLLEGYFEEKPIIYVDGEKTKIKFKDSEYTFSNKHAEAFYTSDAKLTPRPEYFFEHINISQYISRNSDDKDIFVFMILSMLHSTKNKNNLSEFESTLILSDHRKII